MAIPLTFVHKELKDNANIISHIKDNTLFFNYSPGISLKYRNKVMKETIRLISNNEPTLKILKLKGFVVEPDETLALSKAIRFNTNLASMVFTFRALDPNGYTILEKVKANDKDNKKHVFKI